jgi:hypothetical protein
MMGCDIHVIVEKKYNGRWVGLSELSGFLKPQRQEDGKWVTDYISHPGRARDYERFAALACVRGEGPAPKGLPADASELARMLYPMDDSDLHSHSWLGLAKAAEIYLSTEYDQAALHLLDDDPRSKDPYSYYFDVEGWGWGNKFNPDDYRIVFAFDN